MVPYRDVFPVSDNLVCERVAATAVAPLVVVVVDEDVGVRVVGHPPALVIYALRTQVPG